MNVYNELNRIKLKYKDNKEITDALGELSFVFKSFIDSILKETKESKECAEYKEFKEFLKAKRKVIRD